MWLGSLAATNAIDTPNGTIHGKILGGPNPVGFATLKLYATGNSSGADVGYGGAGFLLNTTTTDANGNFTFPAGGNACPAGQYGYVMAMGGRTGSSAVNPNALLMAALGPCSTVTSSRVILINELTTIVAAYTLSNFMTVTGTVLVYTGTTLTSGGYNVNVGAPITNNAAQGCVNNTYYTGCTVPASVVNAVTATGAAASSATVSAGLKHAFANAAMLVDTYDAYVPLSNGNGAIVPVTEINTIGNILQACINSAGSTAASTTTTNDGTPCGKLFSYTATATPANVPNNTLSAVLSLVKRPTGNATLYDSSCSTAGGGTVTVANCIFLLSSSIAYYAPAMTAAPTDYTLSLLYPQTSFGGPSTPISCVYTGSTPATITVSQSGLLYPYWMATDIDDNIVITNSESSNAVCSNVISIKFDGTPIGTSTYTNIGPISASSGIAYIGTDAYGHAIVPGGTSNVVNFYTAGPSDGAPTLVASPATPGNGPIFVGVDASSSVYLAGNQGVSDFQLLTATTVSHASPSYTDGVVGAVQTTKLKQLSLDINGLVFAVSSSGGTSAVYSYVPGAANYVKTSGTGYTSSGVGAFPDNNGNYWEILRDSTGTTANNFTDANKSTYTPKTAATVTAMTNVAQFSLGGTSQTGVVMDGNNILWWSDTSGVSTPYPAIGSFIRGYDTVNNFAYPVMNGCVFETTASSACGNTSGTANKKPFPFYGVRGVMVDATGSLWTANGTQGQVSEVIGLASPTLPLFVHNGISMKP